MTWIFFNRTRINLDNISSYYIDKNYPKSIMMVFVNGIKYYESFATDEDLRDRMEYLDKLVKPLEYHGAMEEEETKWNK